MIEPVQVAVATPNSYSPDGNTELVRNRMGHVDGRIDSNDTVHKVSNNLSGPCSKGRSPALSSLAQIQAVLKTGRICI